MPPPSTLLDTALTGPTAADVRRRVLHQLLGSLLYENAVRAEDGQLRCDNGINGDNDDNGVRYTFRARRRYTFGRVTVDDLRRDGLEPQSISLFLAEIAPLLDADPSRLPQFARELEETYVKDALAQQHRRNTEHTRLHRLDVETLEGAITDGHRYHPSYKSRLGFGIDDNLAYGPEFRPDVRPLWLSVDRSIVETSAVVDEASFLREQYPAQAESGRTLVPVHPWQWDRHLAAAFAGELTSGSIRVLGPDPDRFRPQQSIRTLACLDRPHRPYLKLAMSLVNTSTSRVLAPHTVHNAPAVSAWLAGIAADDPLLRDELRTVFLRELMGTAVVAGDDPVRRDATYGTLACIWRESLHPHLDPDESGVPFTGLTARNVDGTPLIDPWVREQGVAAWVRRIAEVVVVPVLHLLCHHGIALESHAQNMVLLHRSGMPTRVALRDFHDGVRFCRERLADPDRCPTLRSTPPHHENRNSFVETDDPSLVADFVLDALLFVGIGELALFLADAYGFDEEEFWSLVREVLTGYLDRFPDPRYDVLTPEVAVEKLTSRRLLPDTELRVHPVPNPLAAADPRPAS